MTGRVPVRVVLDLRIPITVLLPAGFTTLVNSAFRLTRGDGKITGPFVTFSIVFLPCLALELRWLTGRIGQADGQFILVRL